MENQEEKKQEQIHVTPKSDEIRILHGNAPDPVKKDSVHILGTIDAPQKYLEKRQHDIVVFESHILVNREEGYIELIVNEHLKLFDRIKGSLYPSKEYANFGINTGKEWGSLELAQFIKMNRTCFESKEIAMDLTSKLQSFKAQINKSVESESDNRGSYKALKEQAIKSINIPESFKLEMPLFPNMEKEAIEVEIYIDPANLSIQLISPEAADIIQLAKNSSINKVLKEIKDIVPELVIIEM